MDLQPVGGGAGVVGGMDVSLDGFCGEWQDRGRLKIHYLVVSQRLVGKWRCFE